MKIHFSQYEVCPYFLEKDYLLFPPLRYDIGRQWLVVASYLTCLLIKLTFCIFEWLFLWPLILCWNRKKLKLKNAILFKQHEKPLWRTISCLLICHQKLNNIYSWNILFCIGKKIKETVKVIWFLSVQLRPLHSFSGKRENRDQTGSAVYWRGQIWREELSYF